VFDVFHLEEVGTMLNLMCDLLFSMNKHLPVFRGNPYFVFVFRGTYLGKRE
jgi:hypothetical protein